MIAFLKRNLLFSRGWFQVPMLKPLRGSCFQLKESEVLPAMRAWSMMIQFSLLVAMLPYASTTGKRSGCVGFLVVPLGLFFFGFSWCSSLKRHLTFVLFKQKHSWDIWDTCFVFFTWSVTTISGFAYLWFMNLLSWSFIQWRDTDRLEDFGGNFHPKRYAFKKSFVTSILTLGARVGEGCEAVLCTWHDLAMLRPLAQSTLQQWSGTARTHGEWFIWIRLSMNRLKISQMVFQQHLQVFHGLWMSRCLSPDKMHGRRQTGRRPATLPWLMLGQTWLVSPKPHYRLDLPPHPGCGLVTCPVLTLDFRRPGFPELNLHLPPGIVGGR